MSVSELSRDRIEGRLASLEKAYRSFPVNQTTLCVSSDIYERARERCEAGLVDLYVTVYNGSGEVLVVEEGDGTAVPHAETASEERLEERACRVVRETAGVDCTITDVARVTIVGVLDEDDPDSAPVYRLLAVLSAEYAGGTVDDGVEWRASVPESAVPEY